jgi:signal peptidase
MRPELLAYAGSSMWPVLRHGDLLQVACPRRTPRSGDVVVYRAPRTRKSTVHRIVGRDREGFVTRGDNNRQCDPYRLNHNRILGIVTAVHRGPRVHRVSGGAAGLLGARLRGAGRAVARSLKMPLRPLYRALRHPGLGLKRFSRRRHPKLVAFRLGDRTGFYLIHDGRPVGYQDQPGQRWNIGAWRRLFVDESSLTETAGSGHT